MKKIFIAAISALALFGSCKAAEVNIGFVNFKNCVEISKFGRQEKNAFDAMKKQMSDSLEKTDRELSDIAKKLEDKEYLDGLSPTAEEDLRVKFQTLSQEFARCQSQYYQLLNQANYKMLQSLNEAVSAAAEKVRDKHDLVFMVNEESTFAFAKASDYTDEVIQVMDANFETSHAHLVNKTPE